MGRRVKGGDMQRDERACCIVKRQKDRNKANRRDRQTERDKLMMMIVACGLTSQLKLINVTNY